MQVPAPFEYERATSVEHALDLLARLGPEARLLAGGHSLLPMMKLRLATPEHLVDIDALAGELGLHPRGGRRGAHRRDDPPPRSSSSPSCSRSAWRSSPTPSASSPTPSCATAARSAARCARPTRPRTSPRSAPRVGAHVVIRGPGRRAGRRHARVPPRRRTRPPSATARCSRRSASRCTTDAGSAYEKVERRVGDWAVAAAGAAVRLEGGTIAQAGHRARRGRLAR